jgi:hypothetical protein
MRAPIVDQPSAVVPDGHVEKVDRYRSDFTADFLPHELLPTAPRYRAA